MSDDEKEGESMRKRTKKEKRRERERERVSWLSVTSGACVSWRDCLSVCV